MRVGIDLLRRIWRPSVDPNGYPFDLSAGDKRVRHVTGYDFFPWPSLCGAITSGMPQYFIGAMPGTGIAPSMWGPGTGALPVNLQWQTTIEGLTKVQGVSVG